MNNKENCKKEKGYIMKRFLSILFAFTVLFTSIPINAIATSEDEALDEALIKSEDKIEINLNELEEERISFEQWRDPDDGDPDWENEEDKYKNNDHDYVIIKLKDEDKNKRISCRFRNQENSWLRSFSNDKDETTVYSRDSEKKIENLYGLVAVGNKVYYIDEEFNDSADEPAKDPANDSVEPAGEAAVEENEEAAAEAGEAAGEDQGENEETESENQVTKEVITDDEGTPTALENEEAITDDETTIFENELFNSGNPEEKIIDLNEDKYNDFSTLTIEKSKDGIEIEDIRITKKIDNQDLSVYLDDYSKIDLFKGKYNIEVIYSYEDIEYSEKRNDIDMASDQKITLTPPKEDLVNVNLDIPSGFRSTLDIEEFWTNKTNFMIKRDLVDKQWNLSLREKNRYDKYVDYYREAETRSSNIENNTINYKVGNSILTLDQNNIKLEKYVENAQNAENPGKVMDAKLIVPITNVETSDDFKLERFKIDGIYIKDSNDGKEIEVEGSGYIDYNADSSETSSEISSETPIGKLTIELKEFKDKLEEVKSVRVHYPGKNKKDADEKAKEDDDRYLEDDEDEEIEENNKSNTSKRKSSKKRSKATIVNHEVKKEETKDFKAVKKADISSIKYIENNKDDFRPNEDATRLEVIMWLNELFEFSGENKENIIAFPDIETEYISMINNFTSAGIVKGYPDGSFKPNNRITRAEFVNILNNAFKLQAINEGISYPDIENHWAKNEINILSSNNYIKGYPDGSFKPDNNITRAEVVTLINRIIDIKKENTKIADFKDLKEDFWAYNDINSATKLNK